MKIKGDCWVPSKTFVYLKKENRGSVSDILIANSSALVELVPASSITSLWTLIFCCRISSRNFSPASASINPLPVAPDCPRCLL